MLLDVTRHPRIKSVRDDIIEFSPIGRDFCNAAVNQAYVGKPKVLDHFLSMRDRARSQVDARELALRQAPGHRNQVGPISTAQFQYTATCWKGWFKTQEGADYRQALRVGLGMGIARIKDFVVA